MIKLLIVDDEMIIAQGIAHMIKKLGFNNYQTQICFSGYSGSVVKTKI